MSFGSMFYTREALRSFVDTAIQPGDRVAVIRGDYEGTRTEWFTGDKQALREKIASLQYNQMSTAPMTSQGFPARSARVGFSPFAAFSGVLDLQKQAFTAGTLGTIATIVRAMGDLPGRKALVLASDGFPLIDPWLITGVGPSWDTRILDAAKMLVDDANRSFVVLYAVDTRRLVPHDPPPYGRVSFDLTSATARALAYGPAEGPAYLAHAGGGFYLRNSNDLASLFSKVLHDQDGYYLVSYEPDERTFEQDARRRRPAFHTLKLKVNRPDVRVRARSGFFGVSDETLRQQRSKPVPPDQPDPPPPTRYATNQ